MLLQCALNCIPVMTNDVGDPSIGHLDILFMSMEDFANFLTVPVSFKISVRILLYILDMVLCQI